VAGRISRLSAAVRVAEIPGVFSTDSRLRRRHVVHLRHRDLVRWNDRTTYVQTVS